MPTPLGEIHKRYGGMLPDNFVQAGGTGDFAVIPAVTGIKYAISWIHISNEGTALKQFILRNGTSGAGPSMGRFAAAPDVEGLTVNFDPPVLVDALYADAVAGADQCYIATISKKIEVGVSR